MSRRVFFRDSEAQGFTTYGLLLDTLFRQLKTVGIPGYFPYEYHEDMSCDYAELVSFFGEEFGRLAEQEADASNLSILRKHVSLRGILLERYRKDNERYLAARNSLSIGRLKRVEDKNEPSWAELVASAEDEDKKEAAEGVEESEEAEGAEGTEAMGIQDRPNNDAVNSFLAAIKSAHAVDDSVAPEYIEEDDEEPVSGYSSEEDWGEDEDPSVLPADEDEEEGEEEDGEEDEGYDVLPADDDEEEDPSVLPDDEDEEYSSDLPADDDEEYSSELPADESEEDSSVLPEDDDEDDEEYSSELPADEDSDEDTGYSSELPADDDEEDSSILPDDEDDEDYSSELPADDDDEEYSSELPADEDEDADYSSELPADDDEDYSSELPEDDEEDYSSELPEDDDEDYSSELPEDDDDGDSGVLPDDDDEPASFKSAPQPKTYTSLMMSYSAPVSSMVVRPSYARGIPGRETQEAVLDMMNKLANNIKGWFSRL